MPIWLWRETAWWEHHSRQTGEEDQNRISTNLRSCQNGQPQKSPSNAIMPAISRFHKSILRHSDIFSVA